VSITEFLIAGFSASISWVAFRKYVLGKRFDLKEYGVFILVFFIGVFAMRGLSGF